ncbi:hypothetical protein J3R83DRAFT_5107 [Lanmaoa asiatica]|nr:hypothetical protein J3R83DRAFT_5107 [Lanmaoa asiatica]
MAMGVFPSASIYQWVVSGLALVIFKLIVDKALSVQMAFAKIKYVCSTGTLVSISVPRSKG